MNNNKENYNEQQLSLVDMKQMPVIDVKKKITLTEINWFLVTNHINLLNYISSGILGKQAFQDDELYFDSFFFRHDQVMLFPTKTALIEIAETYKEYHQQRFQQKREPNYKPCFVRIDLSQYLGKGLVYRHHQWEEIELNPESDFSEVDALLLPTLFPITWINEIYLLNKEDKKEFEKQADRTAALSIKLFEGIKFSTKKQFGKQHIDLARTENEIPNLLDTKQDNLFVYSAVGSMIAILQKIGEKYTFANTLLNRIEDYSLQDKFNLETFVKQLKFVENTTSEELFGQVVTRLINKNTMDIYEARNEILDVIQHTNYDNEKMKEAISEILTDLRSIVGISTHSLDELLEKHKKSPITNAFLLFFAKDKFDTLISEKNEHLRELHIILACILLAIITPLSELEKSFKEKDNILFSISDFMSRFIRPNQQVEKTIFPKTVYSFFDSEEWNKKQGDVAKNITIKYKLSCIKTVINDVALAKLNGIKNNGETEVNEYLDPNKYIKHIIDKNTFMNLLPELLLSEEYQKIRAVVYS